MVVCSPPGGPPRRTGQRELPRPRGPNKPRLSLGQCQQSASGLGSGRRPSADVGGLLAGGAPRLQRGATISYSLRNSPQGAELLGIVTSRNSLRRVSVGEFR